MFVIVLLTIFHTVTSYIVPSIVPAVLTGSAQFSILNSPYNITQNTVVDTSNSLVIDPGKHFQVLR